MRFQVPQFLEVEDKIFGPLTFKQFIYLGGGIGMGVVLFVFLPKFIAAILAVPFVAFGVALAFYRVNDKPFITIVEAFVKYYLSGKLYLWKKEEKPYVPKGPTEKTPEQIYVPKLSESKLKELTWSLDVQNNSNPVTSNQNNFDSDQTGSGF